MLVATTIVPTVTVNGTRMIRSPSAFVDEVP